MALLINTHKHSKYHISEAQTEKAINAGKNGGDADDDDDAGDVHDDYRVSCDTCMPLPFLVVLRRRERTV